MSTIDTPLEFARPLDSHGGDLLSTQREAEVFWALRRRLVLAAFRRLLREARLRAAMVAALSVVFWVALYFLFYSGFDLLNGLYPGAVSSLYNAFFVSLMVMLLFSSGIIMYTNLYRSPEAAFLLTTPSRPERVFAYLFQEALWYSSWGFVLLGSPMLVAYGTVTSTSAPLHYYLLLLPFMLAFLYIPVALGAVICILVVDRLGRIRWALLRWVAVVGAIGVIWLTWSIFGGGQTDLLTPLWFRELSERLRFTENRLLPSWWLSTGLLEAARRPIPELLNDQPWSESVRFLALLVSNAFACHLLAIWVAGRWYRSSYSRLHTAESLRRRNTLGFVDSLLLRRFRKDSSPPSQLRLLLVKELRLFLRDPVQWSQSLIFFGLLALYFISIRRFRYNVTYSAMIGFLNLGVVGLILSTFTTRFIFPMLSLEGRRFWILAVTPVSRDKIVWTKFVFAAGGSLFPCCGLMLLSDAMLDIQWQILAVHQLSCAALCLGLSGIAVGLGAKMPELREQNPSKIAAGFGGTLNLVLSAVFILVIVSLTAAPYHFYLMSRHGLAPPQQERLTRYLGNPAAITSGIILTVVLGAIATIWPLYVGLKSFRRADL
jgi:ABC-2 type transport system permease protein